MLLWEEQEVHSPQHLQILRYSVMIEGVEYGIT